MRYDGRVLKEAWEPVGFGDCYEVGTFGVVRNVKTGKALAGTVNEDGHVRVCLSAAGKHKSFYVHILVAGAFLGPCPEGQQVRHWDGNPRNNRLDNLLYGTPKENCEDRDIRHGRNGHANKTRCGTCGLPYDEANTYIYPNGSKRAGARACRNCIRESGRRHDKQRRERRNRQRRERRAGARDPEILTTGEAADLLGVSSETIRRWCKQGILRSERPKTSHLRVYRSDAEKLAAGVNRRKSA
jgi:excisionase family DNA binding protein